MSEKDLQIWVARYIRKAYPQALFHSDYGAGVKLTMAQAATQKAQNGGLRGWPDMFIAEPRNGYLGLFVELKKQGTRIYKKDGSFANDHIAEQFQMMNELSKRGYFAEFACGIDEARKIIDDYFGGNI